MDPGRPEIMGKWTDKLYITHGEWKSGEFRGGLSKKQQQDKDAEKEFKRLPFDHCALSLRPFEVPVCTKEGIMFDLEEIERFIRLHSDSATDFCKCPISGNPLCLADLHRLYIHRNEAGEACCPVTGRIYAENSTILASLRNGQVYSAEAVDQMCESGIDFTDDLPCRRSDFVCIVDPESVGLRRNCAPRIQELKQALGAPRENSNSLTKQSTGMMAASLTSTSMHPVVRQELRAAATPVARPLRNANIIIRTTHGDCQAILMAPVMPATVHSFLARSRRGDYCNSPISSIVAGVLTCGPLTTEDTSPEEYPRHLTAASAPGVLGLHQQNELQFYVTLSEAPSGCNGRHIFGKLDLKNAATLDTMARLRCIPCGADARPLEYASVLDILVMYDPYPPQPRPNAAGHAQPKPKTAKSNSVGKYLNI